MMERKFVNEKGNHIRISVERRSDLVHYEIEGPSSITTGDITPKEAHILAGLLALHARKA